MAFKRGSQTRSSPAGWGGVAIARPGKTSRLFPRKTEAIAGRRITAPTSEHPKTEPRPGLGLERTKKHQARGVTIRQLLLLVQGQHDHCARVRTASPALNLAASFVAGWNL